MTTHDPHESTAVPQAETEHWADWAAGEPAWEWPDGKTVAATLTFDVDAETNTLAMGQEHFTRLGTMSEQRYGLVRGIPRILDLFRRHELKTTFFIPGWTAENYPHVVETILNDGHEIGHHGYLHTSTFGASADDQRSEIERGFKALEAVGAPRPRGYRNPGGEMTLETVKLLDEYGFDYDSSFLGDDRPYVEKHGDIRLLELPWHWSLDDWPYFGFAADYGGNVLDASVWRQNMWNEYESALDERRNVNFVCHPEFIGRGYRFRQLARLLDDLVSDGRAWIPTLGELADHVRPKLSLDGPPASDANPATVSV
jgi:peptidoglycan-N-acetylglucosamine deacetylase